MQHHKNTTNLSEIAKFSSKDLSFINTFERLLGLFDLRYINKLIRKAKSKGILADSIFQILFVFQYFSVQNVHQYIKRNPIEEVGLKKDVFYEFLRNPNIDWRRIMYLFIRQLFKLIEEHSVENHYSKSQPSFFIVDDTLIQKTGKNIENISMVYDHVEHSYKLGYKLLTLGFYDGKSFFPLDFSLHFEQGKNANRGLSQKSLANQYLKERHPSCASALRLAQMQEAKNNMMINLIQYALQKNLKADYVLFDSWFMSAEAIHALHQLDPQLNIISPFKSNRRIVVGGKSYSVANYARTKESKAKYSRKFKCRYFESIIQYQSINLKAFWIKMKGQSQWHVLVSTDLHLNFSNLMKYYAVRWTIEVFFKDCKQTLRLEKCHSVDLDAHFAYISIVLMNYMLLSLKRRFEDYESIGGMFRDVIIQVFEKTIAEKILEIITTILENLSQILDFNLEYSLLKIIRLQIDAENLLKIPLAQLIALHTKAP